MAPQLFAPVCSITMTKRRRFFWAAWWTSPPMRAPFGKPDASNGGASTHEEALAAAVAAAGRSLTVIEPDWARAWIRILRGQPAWLSQTPPVRRAQSDPAANPGGDDEGPADPASIWTILGAPPQATEAELKLAFRRRALETHPDHGGDPETFRRVIRAYAEARRRIRRPRRQR